MTKKLFLAITLFVFAFTLIGCDFFGGNTTTTTTSFLTNTSTTSTSSATTTSTTETITSTTTTTTSASTTTTTTQSELAILTALANKVIISDQDNMTSDFTVPAEVDASTVTWSSGNTDYVTVASAATLNTGGFFVYLVTITRPDHTTGDVTVVLTGTFQLGETTYQKTYSLRIRFLEDASLVTTIAAGLAQPLGTFLTWKDMTILGVGTDGFFFTDGTDIMFVYSAAVAATVQAGEVYNIIGGIGLYNSIPEVQNIGTNVVSVVLSEADPRDVTPVVATIDEIIANHVGYSAENPMVFGVYTVTGKVYYDEAKGNYSTYLVASDASTLDKTHAIRIYYKSNMPVVSALAGQIITLDIVLFGFNSGVGYLDWYAYFFGTADDITTETMTDADKLVISVGQLDSTYEINTSFSLPTPMFGTYSNITISPEISAYLSYSVGIFTVVRPVSDTTGTLSVTATVNAETEIVVINITMKAEPVATPMSVIISQAYGGGGNSGSVYKSDFIELYNATDSPISLNGYYIFYAAKTGTFNYSLALTGTIPAHGFFLIQMATGAGGTTDLPTPDQIGTVAMASDGFKIALCNSSTTPINHASLNLIDYVGAGASNDSETALAPTPSNTNAIIRNNLVDTNDNSADFITAAPTPRNTSIRRETVS